MEKESITLVETYISQKNVIFASHSKITGSKFCDHSELVCHSSRYTGKISKPANDHIVISLCQ